MNTLQQPHSTSVPFCRFISFVIKIGICSISLFFNLHTVYTPLHPQLTLLTRGHTHLYQTLHFLTGFMGLPTGQLKALAKSGEFMATPLMRHWEGETVLLCVPLIGNSSFLLMHHERLREIKNSCSGVYFSRPGSWKFLYLFGGGCSRRSQE